MVNKIQERKKPVLLDNTDLINFKEIQKNLLHYRQLA